MTKGHLTTSSFPGGISQLDPTEPRRSALRRFLELVLMGTSRTGNCSRIGSTPTLCFVLDLRSAFDY